MDFLICRFFAQSTKVGQVNGKEGVDVSVLFATHTSLNLESRA